MPGSGSVVPSCPAPTVCGAFEIHGLEKAWDGLVDFSTDRPSLFDGQLALADLGAFAPALPIQPTTNAFFHRTGAAWPDC